MSKSRTLLATLSLVLLAACGSDSSTGLSGSLEGAYTLRTLNGQNLPFFLGQSGGDRFDLVSGLITINAGNSFTDSFVLRTTTGTQVVNETITCQGTYTVTGNSITLSETQSTDCGGQFTGTMSGSGTLIVALDPTLQGVFQK